MVLEPGKPVFARRAHPTPVANDKAQLLGLSDGSDDVAHAADAEGVELAVGRLQLTIVLPGMSEMLHQ
jgi:hypothetical protein